MTDSKIFKGDWICAHEFLNKQPLSLFHRDGHELCGYAHDDALYNIHMLVRKKLYIKNPNEYKRVKIKISADDYYKLYINGQFAAQDQLRDITSHIITTSLTSADFLPQAKIQFIRTFIIRGL